MKIPSDDAYGLARVDVVMSHWREIIAEHDYWRAMPNDDVEGELRPLVMALLRPLWWAVSIEDESNIVWTAAEHGTFRRRQNVECALVDCDIAVIGHAIRRLVTRDAYSVREQREARRRLKVELRLARLAAARGYLRFELEGRGEWPACVQRLVSSGR